MPRADKSELRFLEICCHVEAVGRYEAHKAWARLDKLSRADREVTHPPGNTGLERGR